ncbi:hypothetical protein KC318_g11050 [Hortaea werneckii]|uniref:PRELI/MSF1 domain-containing protein n=1 Tax=Hortaea werneckii TaxID=91943 RepID=A0A3M6YBL5_HORWE|nr:hypothetical protein KC334_g11022 [Hortaea werneckii]KAI7005899.1 hypothetical protein KC355_g8001 [Hortaea werneckii]KAI7658741.1 hypothetical protein KC318_g11050 [Hortaea werneckii]RMX83655.1 hypothetical protein D0867_16068 [Hortaea werneckii]RMY00466.1 hypothetical protein D0866_15928 [Hortaea werneckii]
MVKFYSKEYTYDYAFPAVSLAYFLRYPNPYSRHVASTDTISRHFDPETQRLTTVRLHLKRSRLPPAVVKLLPKSMMADRAGSDGSTQSFILEKSVVDAKQGWMECESRNLDWENVLSVFERHSYRRAEPIAMDTTTNSTTAGTDGLNGATTAAAAGVAGLETPAEQTHVAVSVTLKSRIGEQLRKKRQRWGEQASASSVMGGGEESAAATALGKPQQPQQQQQQQQQGWFSSWGSGAVRSAIESISLQRTEKSQPKAQKGMSVVLSRLRSGGIQEVLEGMRRDREVEI